VAKGVLLEDAFLLMFFHNLWWYAKLGLPGHHFNTMATLYAQHPSSTPTRRPGSSSFVATDSKEHVATETVTETTSSPAKVTVHALSGGRFSLPEEQFVSPSSPGARHPVPSLCFLIQHTCPTTDRTTRIVFDLGLRRDVKRYPEPIQRHLTTREPYNTDPHVVKSLKAGGLTPDDIDYVVYSHVCIRESNRRTDPLLTTLYHRFIGIMWGSHETLLVAGSSSATGRSDCFVETLPNFEAITHISSQICSTCHAPRS
jgi:hypothetical protein